MSSSIADDGDGRRRPPMQRLHLLVVMAGLVILGGTNFVLLKVMYTAYGDSRGFFVNQAINLLYIVYGGAILYPRMICTKHVTRAMRHFPQRHFVIMGVLDSLGTFFTCLGTAYTPGSITPLLNQLLIPFTMLVSRVYLSASCHRMELVGAGLIVAGACLSVIPDLIRSDEGASGAEIRWYAVVLYAISNLPMSMSACYKEGTFEEKQLDVWYLTQWVSIYQFLVSFLYMPLLVLPGFGSRDGMTMAEVRLAFSDGFSCFMEYVPECAERGTFRLLVSYVGVNVCFGVLGLYLTKHGSAVLNALSYSILLPFTTLLFFTPLLGPYQEPLTNDSVFTFLGLMLALTGFAVYQRFARGVGEPKYEGSDGVLYASPLLGVHEPSSPKGQPSFQERVVGMVSSGDNHRKISES